MGETTVHYGKRTVDDLHKEGRREVARAVLTRPEEECIQLIFTLETYRGVRGSKNYTLYIDKQRGDDGRTKSRVEDVSAYRRDGFVMVEDNDTPKEILTWCKDYANHAPDRWE